MKRKELQKDKHTKNRLRRRGEKRKEERLREETIKTKLRKKREKKKIIRMKIEHGDKQRIPNETKTNED